MLRTNAIVRTVWIKDLVTEKRQGPNGEFDAKSILFRIATPRNYKRTVMKDGQPTEEYPTDYILCRANGSTAQVIADTCSMVDPTTGKHVSRHLALYGHIETYVQDRVFKIENLPVGINGQTYNLTFDTPQKVDGHIFIVDEIEFLDPKPQPKVVSTNGVTVSNVQVAPVQAQTAQATAPVNQVQVPVPQNVAPVVQNAVPVQVAQPQVQSVANAMNPPVVPEGYTGEASPF